MRTLFLRHGMKDARRRHTLQLVDRCDGPQLTQLHRSLFGFVKEWHAVPATFVHVDTVSSMQGKLTLASKNVCSGGVLGLQDMFSTTSLPFTLLITYCYCYEQTKSFTLYVCSCTVFLVD